jgi:hypothetical protein
MGIIHRSIAARDRVLEGSLASFEKRRHRSDRNNRHFRDQAIDDFQKLWPLQAEQDARASLVNGAIRRN